MPSPPNKADNRQGYSNRYACYQQVDYLTRDEAKSSSGRIVGVMVNNISNTSRQNARPQRGLSSADLLIECKVEGGITRFCAVYHNADAIPEVGPLRSGRDQFLQLLMPYQALYYHDGESAACTKFISVYNYSGLNIGGKSYFTDVGVNSESPRIPLELAEGLVQSDGISQYKFTKSEFWGWLLWQKEKGKVWKRLMGFTEEPQIDKDFITASFWCDAHPKSPFINTKKLSIFREDCNITIRGNYLKFYLGGRVKYRYKITTGEELKEILWEYFGINVDYKLKDDGIEY